MRATNMGLLQKTLDIFYPACAGEMLLPIIIQKTSTRSPNQPMKPLSTRRHIRGRKRHGGQCVNPRKTQLVALKRTGRHAACPRCSKSAGADCPRKTTGNLFSEKTMMKSPRASLGCGATCSGAKTTIGLELCGELR